MPNNTRERILEAATCVFARKGLQGASMKAIARRARVNEVTLFRLFRSKNRLFRAVLDYSDRRHRPIECVLEALLADVDPLDRIKTGIERVCESIEKDVEFWQLRYQGPSEQGEIIPKHIGSKMTPVFEAWQQVITRAVEEGKLKQCDPTVAFLVLRSLLLGNIVSPRGGTPRLSPQQIFDAWLNGFK